ncbi:MAG: J domain-containing protein, partial [Geminicoccaceae bacterium]
LHPDRNPGDRRAEQHFKDITQAYKLLSDPKARREFDQGRIDASGNPRGRQSNQSSSKKSADAWWRRDGKSLLDRMFARFGYARDQGSGSRPKNGGTEGAYRTTGGQENAAHQENGAGTGETSGKAGDLHHHLEIEFLKAACGGRQRLTPAGSPTLEIDIPPGTEDNAVLRLKGQGRAGRPHHAGGDLLVHLNVLGHPWFVRNGKNIHLDVPISLKEAILGTRIRIPTIDGTVSLAIPPDANSGQTLRLKGRGIADRDGRRGDQFVRLMVMLPKAPDGETAADLHRLAKRGDYEVRDHLNWD